MKAKGNRNGILDSNRKHSLSIAMIGIVAIAALAILAVGASATTSTIEVSLPEQLTSDAHYERNPSFFESTGGTYWLFFL